MQIGKISALVFVMAACSASAQSSTDLEDRRAAVRELYAAQERDKIMDASIKSVTGNYMDRLAQLHPEIAKSRLAKLRAHIERNLTDTAHDYLAQEEELLAQRLELRDLRAAVAFYKSPAGHRLAEATPGLVPDLGKSQVAWETAAITKATNDMNAAVKTPQ